MVSGWSSFIQCEARQQQCFLDRRRQPPSDEDWRDIIEKLSQVPLSFGVLESGSASSSQLDREGR